MSKCVLFQPIIVFFETSCLAMFIEDLNGISSCLDSELKIGLHN